MRIWFVLCLAAVCVQAASAQTLTRTTRGAWTVQTGRDVSHGQVCEAVAIDPVHNATFGINGLYNGHTVFAASAPGWERFDQRHQRVRLGRAQDVLWQGEAVGRGNALLVRLAWPEAKAVLAKVQTGDHFEFTLAGAPSPAMSIPTDGLSDAIGLVQACMWNTASTEDRRGLQAYLPLP